MGLLSSSASASKAPAPGGGLFDFNDLIPQKMGVANSTQAVPDSTTPNTLKGLIQNTGGAVARAGITAALTLAPQKVRDTVGQIDPGKDIGPIGSYVLGDEPVTSLQEQVPAADNPKYGILNKPVAYTGTTGGIALSMLPFVGSLEKGGADLLAKGLTKATTEEAVHAIMVKGGYDDTIAREFAPHIAEMTSEAEVRQAMLSASKIQQAIKSGTDLSAEAAAHETNPTSLSKEAPTLSEQLPATETGAPETSIEQPPREPVPSAQAQEPLLQGAGGDVKPPENIVPSSEEPYFNPEQYVKEQSDARDAARIAGNPSIGERIAAGVDSLKKNIVDKTAPIEDLLYKSAKENGVKIDATEDIHNQIDRVYRANTIAGEFARTNGLDKVIQAAPDEKALSEYLIAKHSQDLDARGIATGRDIGKDVALVKSLAPVYEPLAKQVNEYSQKLLDESIRSGLVSKEMGDILKARYPNYVPFNRVFSDTEQLVGHTNAGGITSLSAQTAVRAIKGSERVVEDPLRTLLARTHEIISQVERNDAAKMLASYEKLPGNPFELKPLRTTKDVEERMNLFKEAADMKPLQTKIENVISTSGRALRVLQREINNLNKDGLKAYLAAPNKEAIPSLVSKVKIKITPEELVDNAPKSFDDLKTSYAIKAQLQKEFKTFDTFLQEVKRGGWSRMETGVLSGEAKLSEAGIQSRSAESIAKQVFKDPVYKAGTTEVSDVAAKLDRGDAKKFIEQMIKGPNVDLGAIKRKIAVRDPKAAALIDSIDGWREEYQNVRDVRMSKIDEGRLLADTKANGKATISFFENGIKNVYETTPAVEAAAKSLDAEQMNVVTKALSVPTRVARLGITGVNPAFIGANLVKDQMSALINAEHPFSTSILNIPNFLVALKSAVTHDALYHEMVRVGGGGTSYDIARANVPETFEKIRAGRNAVSSIAYTAKNPKELLRAVENIASRTEELTRIQQYRGTRQYLLAHGANEAQAVAGAARAARENTVNFARSGEFTKSLNYAVLYLTASINGTRTFLRNASGRPLQTAAQVALAAIAPAAAATYWNLSDPERKAVYNDIPAYEKQNNIIFIPPNPTKAADGKWNVIKIPMSQEIVNLVALVPRLIEQQQGGDPIAFGEVAKALIGTVEPISPDPGSALSAITPQAIKPTIEEATNKNLFTGFPIVPGSLEKLSPEKQVKKTTSGTAIQLAGLFHTSPIKTQDFIKETFGGIGPMALNAADRTQNALGHPVQVGGTSPVTAVTGRFNEAAGGATEQKQTDAAAAAVRAQADTKSEIKTKAAQVLTEIKGMSKEDAVAHLNAAASDPILAKEIKKQLDDAKLGLTTSDKMIAQLQVGNGERAKYIDSQVRQLTTKEEKLVYLNDLAQKKIITAEIQRQLAALWAKK